MRFYTITGMLGPRVVRRGATSALEALGIVEDFRRTGWTMSGISRGTTIISERELRENVAAASPSNKPSRLL